MVRWGERAAMAKRGDGEQSGSGRALEHRNVGECDGIMGNEIGDFYFVGNAMCPWFICF